MASASSASSITPTSAAVQTKHSHEHGAVDLAVPQHVERVADERDGRGDAANNTIVVMRHVAAAGRLGYILSKAWSMINSAN
jgi:hypothetical protein